MRLIAPKRRFGQELMGEAMQESIDGAMTKHFEESGDRPALQPKVEMTNQEGWKEGDDVEVSMSYEALPDIPEVELKDISLTRLKVSYQPEREYTAKMLSEGAD